MSFKPASYLKRYRGKNGWELKLKCPLCGKANLWWNNDRQGGQCFSCHSDFNELKMRHHFREGQVSGLDDLMLNLIKPPRPKSDFIAASPRYEYQKHWQSKWHLETYRKCDPALINRIGVWYEPEEDRICIPIHHVGGAFSDTVEGPHMSRHTDPDIKGWKAQPFGIQKEQHWFRLCPDNLETVVLVEGIFDVLVPRLEGVAIALLGTKLSERMQDYFWANTPSTVVIWLDPDEPGVKGAKVLHEQLWGMVRNVLVVDGQPEPGDLSPEKVREVLDGIL